MPDFGGFIALVDLGYMLRSTRFNGEFNRDVTYSFETTEPYYLQTDWGLAVTQKITTAWDVVGRFGHYKLDYETIGLPGANRRSDSGNRYGGGSRLHAGRVRPAGLRRELHGSHVGSRHHAQLRRDAGGHFGHLRDSSKR